MRAPLADVREEFREKTGAHRVGDACPPRRIRPLADHTSKWSCAFHPENRASAEFPAQTRV